MSKAKRAPILITIATVLLFIISILCISAFQRIKAEETQSNSSQKNELDLASVSINITDLELATNHSEQLVLSNVPGTAAVTWKSSNPSVATVNNNGTVTAKTYGNAEIMATVNDDDGYVSKTCNVQTRFYDVVDKTMSGYTQIYWAADNGITAGYNGGEYFGPTRKCTRQEFAIFLWRTMGQPAPKSTALPFTDTKDLTGSSLKAIAWATEKGIIKGFVDGTFRPKANVTREQIVIMLWRAAGEPKVTSNPTFNDTGSLDTSKSSYKAIAWASKNGIVQGFTDNTFRPNETGKRNQVVIMLYRYGWWRIVNGKVDFGITGLCDTEFGWFFCRNGKVDFNYTGLAKNQYGTWFVREGKIDFDETSKLGYNSKVTHVISDMLYDAVDAGGGKWSYNYEWDNKIISVSYEEHVAGNVFLTDWAGVEDGLFTPDQIKQYPELLTQLNYEGFNDLILFACNPFIRDGKIDKLVNKMNHFSLSNTYEFYTHSGMLDSVKITTKEDGYSDIIQTYKYSYNSAGLLVEIENGNDIIKIDRDDYGFPTEVSYNEQRKRLIYDADKNVTKVIDLGKTGHDSDFEYDSNGRLISARVISDEPYTILLDYSNDGLLTSINTSNYIDMEYIGKLFKFDWKSIH